MTRDDACTSNAARSDSFERSQTVPESGKCQRVLCYIPSSSFIAQDVSFLLPQWHITTHLDLPTLIKSRY